MPTTPDSYDEDASRCTHCRRLLFPHELTRWACCLCEDRARTQLAAIPGLYEQLGDSLAPGVAAPNSGKISVSRTAPLPAALTPLDLRAPGGIVSKLQAIEDNWRAVLGRTAGPRSDGIRVFASWRINPGQDVPAHASFLVFNLNWACERYEEVAYDLGVIKELHDQAQSAVAGHWEARVPIGCCPAVGEGNGQPCGAKLKVTPGALEIRCHECGTRWDRNEWLRLGARMRGIPMPGQAA